MPGILARKYGMISPSPFPRARGRWTHSSNIANQFTAPPAFVEALDRITAWVHEAPLLSFTHRHPQAAINLKLLAILAAGYAVALFLSNFLEIIMGRRKISRVHPLMITRNSLVALFFATTLWVLMEPALFAGGPEPKAQLRLIFNIAAASGCSDIDYRTPRSG